MINYYCPGFLEGQAAYRIYFMLKKDYPQCFYPNVQISKIYGSFPNMIWNGGGYWFNNHQDFKDVKRCFDWYADKGVKIQLNFTNPSLKETDIYDRYCNMILDLASNYDYIEILVTSPILEKYIREKYPNILIDKSIVATTKVNNTENDNLNYHLKQSEQYNKYVLPRKYGSNLESLKEIPEEYRDKFEILVTDPCPLSCPRLYSHYEELSKVQLYEKEFGEECECTMPFSDTILRNWTYKKYQYSYEEVSELLEPLGFTEIKISGRTSLLNVVLSTVEYLIKPEYRKDIMNVLLAPYRNCGSIFTNYN